MRGVVYSVHQTDVKPKNSAAGIGCGWTLKTPIPSKKSMHVIAGTLNKLHIPATSNRTSGLASRFVEKKYKTKLWTKNIQWVTLQERSKE